MLSPTIILDLALNLSFLVALTIVSGFVDRRWPRTTRLGQLVQGMLFGGAAVLGMLRPMHLMPGLIFDGRSVMVSLCALFFGPLAAAVAVLMTMACRLQMGGVGAVMGLLVIAESAALGLWARRRYRPEAAPPSNWQLYLFGLGVHVVMVLLMLTILGGSGPKVMASLALPVLVLYPLSTLLAGRILADQVASLRTEAELKRSVTRFRALYDATSDAVLLTDEQGIFECNQAAVAMFGLTTRDQLLGESPASLSPPCQPGGSPSAPLAAEHIANALARDSDRFEWWHRRADTGETFPTEVLLDAMELDGKPVLQALVRDITERKRAEERLAQQHRLMQTILDTTPGFLLLKDRDGVYQEANPAFCRFLGKSREEIVGTTPFALLPADEAAVHHASDLALVESGQPYSADVLVSSAAGKRWLHVVKSAIRDESGRVTGVLCSEQDITERKQAEEALREREERLRAIIEHTQAGYFRIDREGRFEYVNAAWLRMHGYQRAEEVVGCHFSLTQTPDYLSVAQAVVDALLAGGTISSAEGSRLCRDGSVGYHTFSAGPVTQAGEAVGFEGFLIDITEHKRAEEALREREETYRALVEGLPDVVMRFDLQGRHLFVSDNVTASTGLRPQDFLGRTHREMGFPEHLCCLWEDALQRVSETGAPSETEFSLEGPTGPAVYNWRLVPERDAHGAVRSVLSISRDITAYRRVEEDYRTLFREMLDGFALHEIVCDESGRPVDYRFLALNPAFERMTGLRADELVGRTVLEVLPGTERRWIDTYGAVALTGTPVFFEDYHAGLGKHFEVTAFRPAPGQFACIFADVTGRKATETTMRRVVAAVEHTSDAVAIIDATGRGVYANPAMLRLTGRAPDQETSDASLTSAFIDAEQARRLLDDVLGGQQEEWSGELLVRRPDGQALPVLVRLNAVVAEDGRRLGAVVLLTDLTSQKLAEDSQRLATVGQLAGGVAHEFNNLLAGMMMRAGRAEQVRTREEYEKLTDLVLQATRRGARICEDLTAFARPQQPAREIVAMEAVVEAALKVVARSLEQAGVQVLRHFDTAGRRLTADAGQLEQVLVNLFINACHAMPGGGTLGVAARYVPAAAGPGRILVTVSDTGTGISPENLPRIFEPFFTTKGRLGESDVPGTGLGLAVTYGIVQAHGGELRVASTVGVGTTFELEFAAADPARLAPGAADLVSAPAPVEPATAVRILLADDEEAIAEVVAEGLATEGHHVVIVHDAVEAQSRLAEQTFDLVISDLRMPGGGGQAVLDAVAALSTPPPVIVMTGQTDLHAETELRGRGVRAYLRKPFGLPEVSAAVAEVLKQP